MSITMKFGFATTVKSIFQELVKLGLSVKENLNTQFTLKIFFIEEY